MNPSKPLRTASRLVHSLFLQCRFYFPRQRCTSFVHDSASPQSGIGHIFVINLDRQPKRWADMVKELECISDASGKALSERAVRFPACDARADPPDFLDSGDVNQFYTLGDQLFVEPQPDSVPDAFDLERPIKMTRSEIAVACSHIDVWKAISQSSASYALVLEDDVWFERGFGRTLERAWQEMEDLDQSSPKFDVLYVSYKEVRYGAPKELLSRNVFRPERGLWYLSGYVLSKDGARALLDLLPCTGPIDLWINHKFRGLEVRALSRSVVNQRRDLHSTNSYSILPTLTRIGVLNSGSDALFHQRPAHYPIFAFGPPGSGLTSLAMALSMLGYRCCSDVEDIPQMEFESVLAGHTDRIFDAYVNVGSLNSQSRELALRYPGAKFIVLGDTSVSSDDGRHSIVNTLQGADLLHLDHKQGCDWRTLCAHLRIAPPDAPYPAVPDIGFREHHRAPPDETMFAPARWLQHDPSPWIAKPVRGWAGINVRRSDKERTTATSLMHFVDELASVEPGRWFLRNDTFPGNLALFRPANVAAVAGGGLSLSVIEEQLGVRKFSAAAISSLATFLFGRFEATLQATNIPGLVTGFFLHRDSPRQEIDVEIMGNKPDQLLVNVFFNPGTDGAKFDYGYRGSPAVIKLGFDASKAPHRFAIEWEPGQIRWFVDEKLVHRRAIWGPTPIPHLPMTLHINTWPTCSSELAGRLAPSKLPGSSIVRQVTVDAYSSDV